MQRAPPSKILAAAILQAAVTEHFRTGSEAKRGQPQCIYIVCLGSSCHSSFLRSFWGCMPRGSRRTKGLLWGEVGAVLSWISPQPRRRLPWDRHPHSWVLVPTGNSATQGKMLFSFCLCSSPSTFFFSLVFPRWSLFACDGDQWALFYLCPQNPAFPFSSYSHPAEEETESSWVGKWQVDNPGQLTTSGQIQI